MSLEPTAGLLFDEPTHRYTFDGEPMMSVTQVIGQYKKKFDEEYWSAHVASKPGEKRTQDEIKAAWAAKRDGACDAGDIVHAEAERVAWEIQRTRKFWFCSDPDYWGVNHGKCLAVWSWYTDHIEVADGWLYPELKVCHPLYCVAGTVDLVASNYNGMPALIDWKQSETIDAWDKTAYSNMNPPFQRGKLKLADTNYRAYQLQLSLYRRILAERYQFEAEVLILVHLKPDGTYQEYETPYLDKHVDKILELRSAH